MFVKYTISFMKRHEVNIWKVAKIALSPVVWSVMTFFFFLVKKLVLQLHYILERSQKSCGSSGQRWVRSPVPKPGGAVQGVSAVLLRFDLRGGKVLDTNGCTNCPKSSSKDLGRGSRPLSGPRQARAHRCPWKWTRPLRGWGAAAHPVCRDRLRASSYLRSDRTPWAHTPPGRHRWRSSWAGRFSPRRRLPPPHTWASSSPRGCCSRSRRPPPPRSSSWRLQLLCPCSCCSFGFSRSPWGAGSEGQAPGHCALLRLPWIPQTCSGRLAPALVLTMLVKKGSTRWGERLKASVPFPYTLS